MEHPVEEIKIAAKAKAKSKPRAKPKPKALVSVIVPTHDPDEVPPQPPPPPSREKHARPETPDEFWNNTIKNMKDKKDKQYASLIKCAF
jgi:hypothetical protein